MASAKAITGGTMDVNPQFLSAVVPMVTADIYAEAEIIIPVMRFGFTKGRAQVIEVLKIFYEMPVMSVATPSDVARMQITTQSKDALVDYNNPDCIFKRQRLNLENGTPAGFNVVDPFGMVDYTDGAGHGIIIAGTSLFLGLDTVGYSAGVNGRVKILYRFKNISLPEFVGLSISRT